jgi:DNA-binding NtrC family response regulator
MRTLGAFERAHRGTLLLDEVTEMRLDLQAKLLRAIQEHEIERVGGHQPVRVDVRIIATTNRDLHAEVEAGRFRRDLYFRLHVVPIQMPPLRDRPEDIPALAEYFVAKVASELGVRAPRLSSSVIDALCRRRWSGNVRELGNAIERAVILSRGGELTTAGLSEPEHDAVIAGLSPRGKDQPHVPPADPATEWTLDLATLEARAIRQALVQTGGHRTRAARLLGITDRTLRNKLRAR